ncbi:ferric reductase-like transmembrane domain-containing protein [Candidatus Gottesmanbacteria bacterium]|nr:ferric reductase-like transmembrane domain-containing protein [Candidatus Gottesmanbacteria bacterium]
MTFVDTAFLWSARNKILVIRIFYIFWIFLIVICGVGAYISFANPSDMRPWYNLGVGSGRTALVFFIILLLPGMLKRYGIRHKLLAIILFFRRHLGISMYLFVLCHVSFVALIPRISSGNLFVPLVLFELMGLLAVVTLFFLFITSNDLSVRTLGIWWYRLHKLIYPVIGIIFLHTALQRWSIWSVAIGVIAVLQIGSYVYSKFLLNR